MRVTLTHANHSSSYNGAYTGESCGFVIELDGGPTVYVAGDTNVFSDMQLIGRIYAPDVAILPIGDHFTMGPREAAVAAELIGAPRIVPSHYATFPLLTGTPEALRELSARGRRAARAGSPARRWSCDAAAALVRANRAPGARARARGLGRRERARSSSTASTTWLRSATHTRQGRPSSSAPRRSRR